MPVHTDSVFARVALNAPLPGLYDYRVDASSAVVAGSRVRVPFGRGTRIGVVVELAETSEVPANKLKSPQAILDTKPLFDKPLRDLLAWGSRYYHHPIGEVYATALPSLLAHGDPATLKTERNWQLTDSGSNADPQTLTRAPQQALWLTRLQASPDRFWTRGDLPEPDKDVRALQALTKRGLLESLERPCSIQTRAIRKAAKIPKLNSGQNAAVSAINDSLGNYACHLLEGVTGSGKTEVYLRCIQATLARGEQALVLTPEIGLTPQLVTRLAEGVDTDLSLFHSGLNDRERLDAWLLASSGSNGVVIGTRSAIFTPLSKPGLIIVDEEHDAAYKQQDGWRYSARDLAVIRARQLGIPVVLGSATPSLESLRNVELGRYQLQELPIRAGKAVPPEIRLIDLRAQELEDGLSAPLIDAMHRHLAAGQQALLFLNRRGFAPVLMCHGCGWAARCTHCDANLILHRRQDWLRCHHCEHRQRPATTCPDCGSLDLMAAGLGTERIEAVLQKRFPDYRIARVDRDTMSGKTKLRDTLELARTGAAQILLGTQMLAKGHDFPGVTLAAIVDADQALYGVDFRASERLAQTLTQVIGRAGRSDTLGEVYLQTHQPQHPLFRRLLESGYHHCATEMLTERQRGHMPPHAALALIRAEAEHAGHAREFLEQTRELCDSHRPDGVTLLGPVAAPMERRAGRYRWQLLLRSVERAPLHQLLSQVSEALYKLPSGRRVRWSLDVDPGDLY